MVAGLLTDEIELVLSIQGAAQQAVAPDASPEGVTVDNEDQSGSRG